MSQTPASCVSSSMTMSLFVNRSNFCFVMKASAWRPSFPRRNSSTVLAQRYQAA